MTAAKAFGATLTLLLCTVVPAWAVSNQDGDLVTTFDGSLHPSRLPRSTPAPVAIHVAGNVKSASGDSGALPQLRRITVAINRQGRLFDRGLPICRAEEIQPATESGARTTCGNAIIGSGHAIVQVRIHDQLPFLTRAKLLVFNGLRQDGQRLILAQAYVRNPPGSFILPFHVSKRTGTFGTVLSTTLPRQLRHWAYLVHFEMTLHRVYTFQGRRRSYVSAACSAPPGFESALFPLARATYGFSSGQRLSMALTDTCHVAR